MYYRKANGLDNAWISAETAVEAWVKASIRFGSKNIVKVAGHDAK